MSPLGLGLPLDPGSSTGILLLVGRLMVAKGDLLFLLGAESVPLAFSAFLFRPVIGSFGDTMAVDVAPEVVRSSLLGPLEDSEAFFCAITKSS